MAKTFTEEYTRGVTDKSGSTRRMINGMSCHLTLSTYNKEEALAEYNWYKKFHERDTWSRKHQTQRMTTQRTIGGKTVYQVWNCLK